MNCLAHGDLCEKLGIGAWPTFAFYEDGAQKDKYVGAKSVADLSKLIEEKLEAVRPGSRPPQGIKLPEVGASGVDPSAEPDSPVAEDKDPKAGTLAGEQHNDLVAQKSTDAPDAVVSSEPGSAVTVKAKHNGPPPNPQGISVPLTAESFQKLVTTTQDPWFIKFYSPMCGHCQAMAPNWKEMAKEMTDILNIGEVNCDVETRLCADARVDAYPTIYFFRGGQRVEYTGLRGLGDLLSYTTKAVGPGSEIEDVDAATFKELEETEEVLFLYFYDHATTSEDFRAMERLTLSLVGHARIVKTSSAALAERFKISTWPRLLVVRDGRPNYYNALAPKDMRDFRQMLSWMQTVWLPIVPELTASNAREIMDGKFVVLGILSRRRSDDFKQSKRELKEAAFEWMDKQIQLFRLERSELRDAKQLRIEEADDRNDQRALRAAKNMRITIREDDKKPVAFAWVDGDFWERWLRTTYGIDVEQGDRVIINDEDVSFGPFGLFLDNSKLTHDRTVVTGILLLAELLLWPLVPPSSKPSLSSSHPHPNCPPSLLSAPSRLSSSSPAPSSPATPFSSLFSWALPLPLSLSSGVGASCAASLVAVLSATRMAAVASSTWTARRDS